MCEKLKDVIPRQLFEVPVQAVWAGALSRARPCARMRKDELAKCYGGDITRKKKLLKSKGRQEANAPAWLRRVPSEAFMSVLNSTNERSGEFMCTSPLCRAKCPYCDFYSNAADEDAYDRYTRRCFAPLTARRLTIDAEYALFRGGHADAVVPAAC
jgi:hypothetical protein